MIPGGDDGGREMAVQRPETPDGRTAGLVRIHQKNKFSVGERAELMHPDGTDTGFEIVEILDEEGKQMLSAPHPQQKLYVRYEGAAARYDIIRRRDT